MDYFPETEIDGSPLPEVLDLHVSIDSRLVKPGDIFVCIKGEKTDGHQHIPMAIQHGAIGFLVNRKVDIPSHLFQIITTCSVESIQKAAAKILKESSIKQIAITGSAGKTTTKELLFLIFSQFTRAAKTLGNYNTPIGVPISIINMENDCQVFICELSASYPGEINQNLTFMDLEHAIITGIGSSHLEFFGSTQKIFNEKMKITNAIQKNGFLLINGDQPWGKDAKSIFPNTLSFGMNQENDIQAIIKKKNQQGTVFQLRIVDQLTVDWEIKTFGDHFIYDAIPGIFLALHHRISSETIQQALSLFQAEKGRGKVIPWINESTIIDESYNANPHSFAMSLLSFQSCPFSRKIAVIGDMLELGPSTEKLHYELGKLVQLASVDLVIYRGQYGNFIKDAIRNSNIQYCSFDNNQAIERYLVSIVKKGDGILIKASNGIGLQELVKLLEIHK